MTETNESYSWDSDKREETIKARGLDFVALADFVFADADIVIREDNRKDYGEQRYLAYAMVGEARLCLCFTPRDGKKHLITIFNIHKKEWNKYYDKQN